MVYRIFSNNWYSILVNGQQQGFFQSSRGVKQGDPLSPTLFRIAAEVLIRSLNVLHQNIQFKGFGMPNWSPKINHLAYADDMIIFTSADVVSLQKIMRILRNYEQTSGQKINMDKSVVYMHKKVSGDISITVEIVTGVKRKDFPFMTKPTLWIEYMTSKYCRKENTILVQWKQGSQTWKRMLEARDLIEYQIWWQVRKGDSLFWFDNWTGLGALYYVNPGNTYDARIHNVKEMVVQGRWNKKKLMEVLSKDIIDHITQNVTIPKEERDLDRPWWILDTSGEFTIKSTWDFVWLREPQLDIYRFMWIKGLPFKISFFLWRCWKCKIPTDDVLKKINFNLRSKCWCCINPSEDTMHHLFLASNTAKRTWSFFCKAAGISMEGVQLQQLIVNWWKAPVTNRLKQVYAAVPSIIMWELWKRRNGIKHGYRKINSPVIYLVLISIQILVLYKNPSIKTIPAKWKNLIQMLEGGKARVKKRNIASPQ
ncbi:uncharacterized protein LOC129892399 [Solanum dulcamara]|uniref:uncharacterized protein LOC129892399 n=1 Tax=Solanum dulcamara TaxID=45834 RepID=UPI0024855089|nr:uncharacterized protein LOC129892399 [Solanum dulcamara]